MYGHLLGAQLVGSAANVVSEVVFVDVGQEKRSLCETLLPLEGLSRSLESLLLELEQIMVIDRIEPSH